MNGVHDMGGLQDMGPIRREHGEPLFHAEWERRIFALFNAVDVDWPYRRHRIESISPADYLRMSYYEKWLAALPEILIGTGMATAAEIESGKPIGGTGAGHHVLTVAEIATWNVPDPAPKPAATARFHTGQRVRGRNMNPMGHTRLPRYVRGKIGTIARDCGVADLQDSDIQGLGPKRQHVFSVRFTSRELWGERASPLDSVYVDLWEGYLESA